MGRSRHILQLTSALAITWCGSAYAQSATTPAVVPVAATAPGPIALPGQSAPAATPARAPRRVQLSIGLTVNGAPAGEVTVETDTAGNASVDTAQLLTRLDRIVSPSILDQLKLKIANRPFAPVVELRSESVPLVFDMAGLQLRLDIPASARATNIISIQGSGALGIVPNTEPSGFAAGATFVLAQRLQHRRGFGGIDRDPALASVRGFANYGGKDGLYLTFLGGIREQGRFFRRGTTLFHDNVDDAVRYSIGDLSPQTTGSYQTSSNMIGVGIERSYQDIQPYRNLRPAGRGALTIERPSRVDVMVNGALYRTLTLAPGQYDLRDFPFLNGLNDVQLRVVDDSGRSESLNLSFFSDTLLLDRGVSLFSANLGRQQDSFSAFSSTRYRNPLLFSGYYVRGVTDALTIGGSLQADRRNQLLTAQMVIATPLGIFGVEGALDRSNTETLQRSALISYRLNGVSKTGQQNILAIDFALRSARFSPMDQSNGRLNPYRYDLSARYQRALTPNLYATASAGYSGGRGATRDLRTASAGLSRSFGRINLGATYGYRHDDQGVDHRVNLTLSLPIGRNQSLRSSYNSRRNRVSADYSLIGYDGLDQTSAEVSAYREDGGRGANVMVEHDFNRFSASVTHDYQRADGATTQTSDIALGFGIGIADGHVALGREADRGFTIVAAHPTLKGAAVEVDSRYSLGPTARTGALGSALVPIQRGYQPDVLQVNIPDLPSGYDVGGGRIDILPGAASGYFWRVGSAASHTLIASLVDGKGAGIPYLAGTLRPISGSEAKPSQFFTNRTGRLVAQKLAPGRYAIVPAGAQVAIAEIEVAGDADPIVNAGTLVVKDYQP